VALLAMFLGGFTFSTLGEVLSGHSDLTHEARYQDSPSHDSDGDPCDADCACFCCPGRGPTVILPFRGVAPALASSSRLSTSPLPALHPQDIEQRIFHPPRA
jgi:hypothetical protein